MNKYDIDASCLAFCKWHGPFGSVSWQYHEASLNHKASRQCALLFLLKDLNNALVYWHRCGPRRSAPFCTDGQHLKVRYDVAKISVALFANAAPISGLFECAVCNSAQAQAGELYCKFM